MKTSRLARQISAEAPWLAPSRLNSVPGCTPSYLTKGRPRRAAHLDSRLSEDLMALLGDLRASGRTVLIASHDPIVFTSPLVDQVLELRDGRLVGGAGGD